jgi:hypothetical protein
MTWLDIPCVWQSFERIKPVEERRDHLLMLLAPLVQRIDKKAKIKAFKHSEFTEPCSVMVWVQAMSSNVACNAATSGCASELQTVPGLSVHWPASTNPNERGAP